MTIPEEMRQVFEEKKNLSELRTGVKRKLKRTYPDLRAIVRWHWGYARIYRFNRNRGAAYYLTKYCTKELADFELGGSLVKV